MNHDFHTPDGLQGFTETLTGHISPESAFVVEDYPYGFRLRTQIRYWIETKKGHGQRFVSQTLNPKTGAWNKPKAGNYHVVAVIVRNPQDGHVTIETLHSGGWDDESKVQSFETRRAAGIGEYEQRAIRYIRATIAANSKITVTVGPAQPGKVHQTREEQAALYSAVIRSEYVKLLPKE